MIQIVFNENGKLHTVTFSGDDRHKWSDNFRKLLDEQNISFVIRAI